MLKINILDATTKSDCLENLGYMQKNTTLSQRLHPVPAYQFLVTIVLTLNLFGLTPYTLF